MKQMMRHFYRVEKLTDGHENLNICHNMKLKLKLKHENMINIFSVFLFTISKPEEPEAHF